MIEEDLYTVWSVSEVTQFIKQMFDEQPDLQNVCVRGEISNLTRSAAGHVYFTLKDDESQVSCVKFRSFTGPDTGFPFERGDLVLARGSFSVYLPYGRYQFYVRDVKAAGLGDLYRKFLEIKEKLRSEGLFDEDTKKVLPAYPSVIGLVTSPTGAVLHDILRTFRRKFPAAKVLLVPSRVQGEGAAQEMIKGLKLLDQTASVDTIILARGGGSLEDLWAFNDEHLARTIAALNKPIISAIGHETDFSISDFVADHRAPTPTAAAEMAVPDRAELLNRLQQERGDMAGRLSHVMDMHKMKLDDGHQKMRYGVLGSIAYNRTRIRDAYMRIHSVRPEKLLLRFRQQMTDTTLAKLRNQRNAIGFLKLQLIKSIKGKVMGQRSDQRSQIRHKISTVRHTLEVSREKIHSLETGSILKRGFSLTIKEGNPIKSVAEIQPGDSLRTQLFSGSFESTVHKIHDNHGSKKV